MMRLNSDANHGMYDGIHVYVGRRDIIIHVKRIIGMVLTTESQIGGTQM